MKWSRRVQVVGILVAAFTIGCDGAGEDGGTVEGEGSTREEPAEVPEGLSPDQGVLFTLAATGELEFRHTGGAVCDVYEDELLVSFLQTDDLFLSYELRIPDFTGAGTYSGTFVAKREGAETRGPIELEVSLREGDLLPVLTGFLTGSVEGALGSASLSGTFQCKTDLGDPSAPVTTPSGAWIEYSVRGEATADLREDEVMVCSRGENGVLLARSLGAWVIDIETESAGFGSTPARITLSAPPHLDELHKPGRDPRFYGTGQVTLEDMGTNRFGMPDVEGRFEAPGLTSDLGGRLDLEGVFRCGVME